MSNHKVPVILVLLAVLAASSALAIAQDDPADYVPSDLSPYVAPDPAADVAQALAHSTGEDPKPTGPVPADALKDPNKITHPGSEEAEPPAPTFPGLTQQEAEQKFNPAGDPKREVIKCPDDRVLIVDKIPASPEVVNAPPPAEGYDPPIDPCNPPEGP